MQSNQRLCPGDARCRQVARRMASTIHQLREPFRRNTIRWLEDCVARPLADVDDDLASFFRELRPGMRETTMSSLEHVLNEAVRHFGR